MRRRRLIALPVLVALACESHPTAPSSDNGLTLALQPSATALRPGQPDTLAVTLTNTNPDTVSLTVGGCPLLFYVTGAQGLAVAPPGFCIEVIARLTLAPGAHITQAYVWQTAAVAPGLYWAYGTFGADNVELDTAWTPILVY